MSFNPKHILVPVAIEPEDDVELAELAVKTACDIAVKYHAKLSIVHLSAVLVPLSAAGMDLSGEIYHAQKLIAEAHVARGQEKLKDLQKLAKSQKVEADIYMLETAAPNAEQICDFAQEKTCDLIVVGSHGRKGIKHVLLGSIAERIVRVSHVPVLLLHHANKE